MTTGLRRTATPPPPKSKARTAKSSKSGRAAKKTTAQSDTAKGGFGTRLMTEQQRTRCEYKALEGHLLGSAWARFQLKTDDNRRLAATRRGLDGAAKGSGTKTGKGTKRAAPVKITPTGVEGPAGGKERCVAAPPEYRATTAQVAGLWPWAVGAGAPVIGTPLGRHLQTGESVCFDPMNWFTRGNFITAPSLFVLGLNGFGKSSLVRRIVLGGIAQGITPLVLADVKPDYRDTIEMCGGQVIDLGYGHGCINPLDAGLMGVAVQRLEAAGYFEHAQGLRAELRARQTNLIGGLIELVRGERIHDFEDTLISTGLQLLFTPEFEGGHGFTVTSRHCSRISPR